MKKTLCFLFAIVLTFSTLANAAGIDKKVNPNRSQEESQKQSIIERFSDMTSKKGKDFNIVWNKSNGIPRLISGELSESKVNTPGLAEAFLDINKDLFDVEEGNFTNVATDIDLSGNKHYKNSLMVDGIPVYGTEVIVHVNGSGTAYAINGNFSEKVPSNTWRREFKISSTKAIQLTEKELGLKSGEVAYNIEPTAVRYLYNNNGVWTAIYLVKTQFMVPYPGNVKTFINANTGEIIKSRNEIMTTAATGTGVGLYGTRTLNLDLSGGRYYMRDLTKGALVETYNANFQPSIPGTIFSDTDNNFNSSAQFDGVDAHYNTGEVYDYYKDNFNRNSFNNNGATMKSTVNYREYSSEPYDNAFWNGSQMVYGDGSGTYFKHIGSALDVVAHEFTHAVTSYTSNLEYENQSGALNESMSDVFGYFIEGEANDWLMGEDVWTPNTPGDALRSLADPTLYDQPAHMNDYQNLPNTQAGDWGGVHTNSGIPNKAFYLAATTINDNAKLQQIYYKALTQYLTQYSDFEDCRAALEQAANELYPGTGIMEKISTAFTNVGIGSSTPPTGNDTYETNNTLATAYGPLTSGTIYNSYIYTSTDIDYYYFNTAAAGTISISCTVPLDYDIYLYNSSGTQLASASTLKATETITYNASSAGKFYIKVVGWRSAYSSTSTYGLKATFPSSPIHQGQWTYENVTNVGSPHNYPNNYDNTYVYTKEGALKVSVHFSRFETESSYDFVYIYDVNDNLIAEYSGTLNPFTVEVPGNTIKVRFVSDYSVVGYGYNIDQVGYYQ